MAHIGYGYGSEFHLLRYMGRYRNEFNRLVATAIQGEVESWLDFQHGGKFGKVPKTNKGLNLPDRELKGLEFLDHHNYAETIKAWKNFWPTTGSQPNWDAVGRVQVKCQSQWLLVEAKAHIGETTKGTDACEESIATIQKAFEETQKYFGITPCQCRDWTKKYYQLANRLAVLYFLRTHCIPARLLLVYFLGDKNPDKSKICPGNEINWRKKEIDEQDCHIGLKAKKKEEFGIHELFLKVAP